MTERGITGRESGVSWERQYVEGGGGLAESERQERERPGREKEGIEFNGALRGATAGNACE